LRDPRTFIKPLLRVAACLALLLGIAVLMRPATRAPSAAFPALPTLTTFSDLADLMQRQELATSLASEIDNLAADLTDLTAALNERTLAILF
jgi:bifunctional pyridoxal-dependent enzyme with beta-cystathionase and maltose regulon repressor activities